MLVLLQYIIVKQLLILIQLYIILILSVITLKLSLGKTINLKRALGLSSLLSAIATFLFFAYRLTLLVIPRPLTYAPPMLSWEIFVASTIFLLTRAGTLDYIKGYLILSPFPLYLLSTADDTYHLLLSFLLLTLVIGTVDVTIKYVDREGAKRIGVRGKELIKGVFDLFLLNNGDSLERVFERVGREKEVIVDAILFEGGRSSILIIPRIHPGPFKGVGSSNMPYMLSKILESKGFEAALPLHAPSDHSLDLTSPKYIRQIVERVGMRNKGAKVSVSKPVRIHVKDLTFFSIRLDSTILTVVSREGGGMEDIKEDVVIKCEEALGSNVIMIDGHNSYEQGCLIPSLSNWLGKAIMEGVTMAWERLEGEVTHPTIRAGFYHLPSEDIEGGEIGEGGMWGMVLEVEGEKYFLALLDANNMVKGLRDYLRGEILRHGFKDGEVVTTDTHEVGVRPRRGYEALGNNVEREELKRYVLKVVSEASLRIEERHVYLNRFKVRVKVLGEDVLERLYHLFNKARKWMERMLILTSLLPLLLLY